MGNYFHAFVYAQSQDIKRCTASKIKSDMPSTRDRHAASIAPVPMAKVICKRMYSSDFASIILPIRKAT